MTVARGKRRWLLLGCALLSFMVLAEPKAVTPEQGKARFVKAFFTHITWPDEELDNYFRIGLYGSDLALKRELERQLKSFRVRGKGFRISSITSFKAARTKHMVLVAPANNRLVYRLVRRIRQTNTLIVTDSIEDKRDVMINFTHPGSNVLSFEVNRSNVIYEGLQLSKNILLFGGTELDVATIYKETEAELDRITETANVQRQALTEQRAQLAQQQEKIASQQSLLTQQLKDIARQTSNIKQQKAIIQTQSKNITDKEAELNTLLANLNKIKTALTESEGVLDQKEASIDEYSEQIRTNMALLKSSSAELAVQEKQIREKNLVLTKQGNVIRSQRLTLTVAGVAIVVFLLLLGVIYIGYQAKQRINRKLERQTADLQQANDKLQQMSEAKSLFLSTMSHEIRTPLNGVLGMVELLKDTSLNRQQRHYIDVVHTSGEMLLSVINDVLDFSKIEAGKMQVERIDFNLEKLIYDCAEIFSLRSADEPIFFVDTDPDMPINIKGDPTRIRQILLNFLSNAFKFTETGKITLMTDISDEHEAKLKICVKDTGIGLSEIQLSKIFNAFSTLR